MHLRTQLVRPLSHLPAPLLADPCAPCPALVQSRYTYPKRQRRCILGAAACMAALLIALVALVVAAALRSGSPLTGRQGGEAGGGGGEAAAAAGELELCDWQHWRLPSSVVPSHYELMLEVPLNSSGAADDRPLVQGSVGINVTVLQVGKPACPRRRSAMHAARRCRPHAALCSAG